MARATVTPFAGDSDLIEAEFLWLRAKVKRLAQEKSYRFLTESECSDPPRPGRATARETRLVAVALREREDRLRSEIDTRIAANHRSRKSTTLGLDRLFHQHDDLTLNDRVILLASSAPMVSQSYAEFILNELLSVYGPATVSDCIQLLEPVTAGDWLRHRSLFMPSSALVSAGLIEVVPPPKPQAPVTLLASEVRPSADTFALITGAD